MVKRNRQEKRESQPAEKKEEEREYDETIMKEISDVLQRSPVQWWDGPEMDRACQKWVAKQYDSMVAARAEQEVAVVNETTQSKARPAKKLAKAVKNNTRQKNGRRL